MSNNEQQAVDEALRTGDPDNAARVLMSLRGCSLAEARQAIHEILRSRMRR
jgi:hypothetical protein